MAEEVRAALGRLADAERSDLAAIFDAVFVPDAVVRLCFPFETIDLAEAVTRTWGGLWAAMPDVERRVAISILGTDQDGALWLGQGGAYVGTWERAFEGIPPTGHVAHMRFHEFYRIEGTKAVEMQALWDLPELMMQAGVWPMGPSLGREWHVPGPVGGSGPHDAGETEAARAVVIDMLTALTRHPGEGGPEVMELDCYWHPKCMWYGPSGIGTARGIAGFRRHHQVPFLAAMPDRGQYPDEVTHHFMAEGAYVGVTGWPDMMQTVSGSGWLGIAPTGTKIAMRSLDFWRIEDGLIRENWVLVDLLHMYDQIGVDVLARMREIADPLRSVDI